MTKQPWNKNKSVGQKKGFTPRQLEMIREFLTNQGKTMELALLNLGIDTMLGYSDISKLKVEDVMNWEFCDRTKRSLKSWIDESNKTNSDVLFDLSRPTCTKLIKSWAQHLKLDPENYSTSTLRRTKAASMYKEGVDITVIMKLLGIKLDGKKSIESTKAYLGNEQEEAFEIGKKFMI